MGLILKTRKEEPLRRYQESKKKKVQRTNPKQFKKNFTTEKQTNNVL